jgi:predicted HAD superfamily Cof-like phosphohydrolase
MQLAGQATPDVPTFPSQEVRLLRAKLILEKALETIHALGFNPRVKSYGAPPLDGVPVTTNSVSLIPLDQGYETACSVLDRLVAIADGCADLSVVTTGTLSACGIPDLPILEAVDNNNLAKFGPGHYIRSDGKLIKPPDHQPPDLKAVLLNLFPEVPNL